MIVQSSHCDVLLAKLSQVAQVTPYCFSKVGEPHIARRSQKLGIQPIQRDPWHWPLSGWTIELKKDGMGG